MSKNSQVDDQAGYALLEEPDVIPRRQTSAPAFAGPLTAATVATSAASTMPPHTAAISEGTGAVMTQTQTAPAEPVRTRQDSSCRVSETPAESARTRQDSVSFVPTPISITQEQHSDSTDHEQECRAALSELLENPESSLAAQALQHVIIFVIIASTVSVIVETMPEFHVSPAFFPLEMCFSAIFTIEFSLRLYACDSFGAFATNGFNIIDFLAIFPGYVELLVLFMSESRAAQTPEGASEMHTAAISMRSLRVLRMGRLLRVLRVLRVVKVARHSEGLGLVFAVFQKVARSGLVVVLMLVCFAMVLSASLIYLFESELCEDTGVHCTGPSAFVSIPAAFWWAIATLTTVGYGDMVPHTISGKILGGFTAVIGVIVVSVSIALVSVNFRESYIEMKGRADTRGRKSGPGWSQNKLRIEWELEVMREAFDQRAEALLSKLRAVAARQEDAAQLEPVCQLLASHTKVLSKDVRLFVKNVLSSSACRPKSAIREESPRATLLKDVDLSTSLLSARRSSMI